MNKHRIGKRFRLLRSEDISGVSGTGYVAEGIVFHDGQTIISWYGAVHSVEVWPSLQAAINVHGHAGATLVEWVDRVGSV